MKINPCSINKCHYAIFICFLFFSLIACDNQRKEKERALEQRTVSLAILHDNDLAIAEWLKASIEQFESEISNTLPGTKLNLVLEQESSARSIANLASGVSKAEAILLPHAAFANLMKDQIKNLGAKLSDCHDLIGSPYVLTIPKNNLILLPTILSRSIPELSGTTEISSQTIAIKLHEIGKLLKNSDYGYAHPGRSARGQFSMLLSIAGLNSNIKDKNALWNISTEAISNLQKNLEWYAPSDFQLLKRLAAKNSTSTAQNQKNLSLGIISLRQLQSRPEFKENLAILIPSDATVWESHSLCLSEADWVTPIKKSILQKFQNFLASPAMIEVAVIKGFSSLDSTTTQAPPALPFSESKSELSTKYIKQFEKPFSLSFAIDTSATMLPESIGHLKEFAHRLFINSSADSKIDLIKFSSDVTVLGNKQSLSQNLDNHLATLIPSGGSSIYDAIAKQYELSSKYPALETRRVALLVTDGNDKSSQRSVEDIVELVSNSQRSNGFVSLNLVVIAPSAVDLEPLKKIVDAANGSLYETEPDHLPALLAEIEKSL